MGDRASVAFYDDALGGVESDALLALARDVATDHDDRVLNHLIGLASTGGVRGEMKNLIFATRPQAQDRAPRRDQQQPGNRRERPAPPDLRPAAARRRAHLAAARIETSHPARVSTVSEITAQAGALNA